jgi:hypothetical protein
MPDSDLAWGYWRPVATIVAGGDRRNQFLQSWVEVGETRNMQDDNTCLKNNIHMFLRKILCGFLVLVIFFTYVDIWKFVIIDTIVNKWFYVSC